MPVARVQIPYGVLSAVRPHTAGRRGRTVSAMEPQPPAPTTSDDGPPKGVFVATILLVVASVVGFVVLVLSPLPLLVGLVAGIGVLAGASLLTVKLMTSEETGDDARSRPWSEGDRHGPPSV